MTCRLRALLRRFLRRPHPHVHPPANDILKVAQLPRSEEDDEAAARGLMDRAYRDVAAINRIAAAANLPQIQPPERRREERS